MRKNRQHRRHFVGESIVLSVFSAFNSIFPVATAKRENTKHWIQRVLYSPVYLAGKDFATVKSLHATTYKKNPSLFTQYYEDLSSQRLADMEAGIHPSQKIKLKDVLLVVFVIVLIIVMYKVWSA
jgi:hypothetical protein